MLRACTQLNVFFVRVVILEISKYQENNNYKLYTIIRHNHVN